MITVECDNCFMTYKVNESAIGERLRCKECGNMIKVAKPREQVDLQPEKVPASSITKQRRTGDAQASDSKGVSLRMVVIGAVSLLIIAATLVTVIVSLRKAPADPAPAVAKNDDESAVAGRREPAKSNADAVKNAQGDSRPSVPKSKPLPPNDRPVSTITKSRTTTGKTGRPRAKSDAVQPAEDNAVRELEQVSNSAADPDDQWTFAIVPGGVTECPLDLPPEAELASLEEYTAEFLESKARSTKVSEKSRVTGGANSFSITTSRDWLYRDENGLIIQASTSSGTSSKLERVVVTEDGKVLDPLRNFKASKLGSQDQAALDSGRLQPGAVVRKTDTQRYSSSLDVKFVSLTPAYFGTLEAGQRTGTWARFHDDNQPQSVGAYDNGRRHGCFVFWYQSGRRRWEGVYKSGELVFGRGFSDDDEPRYGETAKISSFGMGRMTMLHFSPNGRFLAVNRERVSSAGWSNDSLFHPPRNWHKKLWSDPKESGAFAVWDLSEKKATVQLESSQRHMTFSRDSMKLIAGRSFWNVQTGKRLDSAGKQESLQAKRARIRREGRAKPRRNFFAETINKIEFLSEDNRFFTVGGKDLCTWSFPQANILREGSRPGQSIGDVSLSPDRSLMIMGSHAIALDSRRLRAMLVSEDDRHSSARSSRRFYPRIGGAPATFSRDSRFLAVPSQLFDQLNLWDVATGQQLRYTPPLTGPINAFPMTLLHDGKTLIVYDVKAELTTIRDLENNVDVLTMPKAGPVVASPDGRAAAYVAMAMSSSNYPNYRTERVDRDMMTLRLRVLSTGSEVALPVPLSEVTRPRLRMGFRTKPLISFSDDSRVLGVAYNTGEVFVWDVEQILDLPALDTTRWPAMAAAADSEWESTTTDLILESTAERPTRTWCAPDGAPREVVAKMWRRFESEPKRIASNSTEPEPMLAARAFDFQDAPKPPSLDLSKIECPVTGKKAKQVYWLDHGKTSARQGGYVFFASEKALEQFLDESPGYRSVANVQLIATGQAVQVKDPVNGKEVDPTLILILANQDVAFSTEKTLKRVRSMKAHEQLRFVFGSGFNRAFEISARDD